MPFVEDPVALEALREKGWLREGPAALLDRPRIATAVAQTLEERHVVDEDDPAAFAGHGAPLGTLSVEVFGLNHPELRDLLRALLGVTGPVQDRMPDGKVATSERVDWTIDDVEGEPVTAKTRIYFASAHPDIVDRTVNQVANERAGKAVSRARTLIRFTDSKVPELAARHGDRMLQLRDRVEGELEEPEEAKSK